ncbi:MAG TPA: hypothetical protein VF503_09165 [Sphingobium sp.]|uniref:hypothetical protein n=1 Tax=Sphingobium sp. TaxID=1912891 RepID=UPI002ED07C37
MPDFTDLIERVNAARDQLTAEDLVHRDRLSGLSALRPAIDRLQAEASALVDAAVIALENAGIAMDVIEGWAEHVHPKCAEIALLCVPVGAWPGQVNIKRGHRVFISVEAGAIAISHAANREMKGGREPIDAGDSAPVPAAIEFAVVSLLEAMGTGAKMRGAVLRIAGPRGTSVIADRH